MNEKHADCGSWNDIDSKLIESTDLIWIEWLGGNAHLVCELFKWHSSLCLMVKRFVDIWEFV